MGPALNEGIVNDTLYGGSDSDLLLGGSGDDELHGEGGGEQLWGGMGAEQHVGGDGAEIDYARYDDVIHGDLMISLDNAAMNPGAAAGDTYFGIEGLVGAAGNDTVGGNGLANFHFRLGRGRLGLRRGRR